MNPPFVKFDHNDRQGIHRAKKPKHAKKKRVPYLATMDISIVVAPPEAVQMKKKKKE